MKIVYKKRETEPIIENIKFNIIKFNNRQKPENKNNVIIFSCFSEFGTEILGTLYCIPRILGGFPGKYSIAVGWQGRSFLYKNLVDEFWEIPEEHMWLRKYSNAFHNNSINLHNIDKSLVKEGRLITYNELSYEVMNPKVEKCTCGGDCKDNLCIICKKWYGRIGVFFSNKEEARYPKISWEKIKKWKYKLPQNSVGIIARNRTTHGRNLPIYYYEWLIDFLKSENFNPVWLGEKVSSYSCPDPNIFDYSSLPEANNLEDTLAVMTQLKFTFQCFTASTRLAGLVGCPFILFESPDQIYGDLGHEGKRLYYCSKSKYKLVITNYNDLLDFETFKRLSQTSILELRQNNYKTNYNLDKQHWCRGIK